MDSKQQALVDKFEAQREQMDARLRLLKARAKEAGADRRVELNEQVEKLEARRESAQSQLEKLRRAGEEAWQDVAEGAKSAWSSLGEAMDRAVNRFS